jgi:hypothetical protein
MFVIFWDLELKGKKKKKGSCLVQGWLRLSKVEETCQAAVTQCSETYGTKVTLRSQAK